jgi:hypothetical protein
MKAIDAAAREHGPRAALNAALTGSLLGLMQWGVLVWLSSYLSSTALVYLLSTAVWLVGSVFGLLLPGRGAEAAWLGAALLAYAACRTLAAARPYDLATLPFLLLLVAVMGAYAGRFYRFRAPSFANVKWLLFFENTGFVGGLLVAVVGLYFWGEPALLGLPFLVAAAALGTARGLDQARGASASDERTARDGTSARPATAATDATPTSGP